MSVQGPNAMDFSGLAALRARAADNDPQVLREVARQFESLFTSMMLKNMRAASFGDPLMGSSEQDGYRDMFDQQMAVEMSRGRGLGIADMLVRQLSGTVAGAVSKTRTNADAIPLGPPVAAPIATGAAIQPPSREEFVATLWPHARKAGEKLGVDPRVIMAQAALETGWGRKTPGDGAVSSNNFFGIKAGGSWRGAAVKADTLEFSEGSLRKERAVFRAYESPAQSVRDYVDFLSTNPRYKRALKVGQDAASFAQGLQQAGYATDPDYASKLLAVMRSAPISQLDTGLKFAAAEPIHTSDALDTRPATGVVAPAHNEPMRS
ncbi:MAG: flagellar assembly peptidoglycan hydrolase FlgJ [Gammaproteobacteria bacterium]|nr:flagellar assembly peptidoglycan hydrolase FlgJ [Gammaproteobacteria bacterium]